MKENLFFCFRSNVRAITRLETLATQASCGLTVFYYISVNYVHIFKIE